jgi:hypothetical protein
VRRIRDRQHRRSSGRVDGMANVSEPPLEASSYIQADGAVPTRQKAWNQKVRDQEQGVRTRTAADETVTGVKAGPNPLRYTRGTQ